MEATPDDAFYSTMPQPDRLARRVKQQIVTGAGETRKLAFQVQAERHGRAIEPDPATRLTRTIAARLKGQVTKRHSTNQRYPGAIALRLIPQTIASDDRIGQSHRTIASSKVFV